MDTVGIVTGAGRGMGLACARRLITAVDRLLLVDLNAEAAAVAAAELSASAGAEVEPFQLDVADADGVHQLATRVAELGTLRAVAHAAGISPTMADGRRILTVDLVGTALLVAALAPLATRGTAFVCFSSNAPYLAGSADDPAADAALDAPLAPDFLERLHDAIGDAIDDPGLAYVWAKRGVHRLVRREAIRLGPAGARICSLSPGLIDTPMNAQEMEDHESMKLLLEHTPLGRLGDPDEIAGVVAFLVSDDASFLTGTDVLVDGGVSAAIDEMRGAG